MALSSWKLLCILNLSPFLCFSNFELRRYLEVKPPTSHSTNNKAKQFGFGCLRIFRRSQLGAWFTNFRFSFANLIIKFTVKALELLQSIDVSLGTLLPVKYANFNFIACREGFSLISANLNYTVKCFPVMYLSSVWNLITASLK